MAMVLAYLGRYVKLRLVQLILQLLLGQRRVLCCLLQVRNFR